MIVTATARIQLREDGIIHAQIGDGAHQSLDDAKSNLSACIVKASGLRRPLLVDMSRCLPLPPDSRHYYSGQVLVDNFTALGLLIDASPLGRMMGNLYLRIARPGIPTQLFTDEESALDWLLAHR